ncbi:MAG: hypothetical protein ACI4F6_05625 [Acutalibacteraceae bacterium]
MNKRNFILNFAFKSKYNFFACLVALLVLIFSVSSITYSWIEGATSLKIKSGTATVYAGSDMAVKVLAQPTGTDATLNLANYIDPAKCSLAPAKGEKNADGTISVQFLNDDNTTYRDATTDDISNNYIFFETKIKPNDDISSYKFKEGSSLSVSSLKLSISLLSADRTTIYYSNIFTAEQVAAYPAACTGLTGGTEYILQFRIWNDVNGDGYTSTPANYNAAINCTLVPQANFTTLYLKDYTNSESSQKILSGKTIKVITGSKTTTGTRSVGTDYDTYTFNKVPGDTDSLKSVKFVAYNSDGTTFATWDLAGTAVATESTYNVYGSASATASFGTYGTLKKVTLVDKSTENLLQASPAVTLTNGTEAYTMYRGTSTTNFTTYVPTSADNFKFSNSTYYAEETTASTSTTPYYYILGESQTTTDGKKKCVGFWSDSAYTAFNNITIKDRSTGRLVEANANTVYASYPDSTLTTVKDKLYKAYYDSAKKEWKLTATNSSFTNNDVGMVWTFKAYASSTATDETYSWHIDGRKAQDSTTYTFKSAVTGTNASDGTWGLYEVSQINPYILYEDGQKLVSFYGGVDTGWGDTEAINGKTVNYINENNKTDGTGDQPAYTTGTYQINSKEYRIAKFVDKPSLDYYLKNIHSFSGVQIGENAQGGKFYGLYKSGDTNVVDKTVSPISGTTKLNGSDSSSSSVLNLYNGPVAFSTVTSSATSLLGETLYIEYFICPTGQENSAKYYCINPSVVDSSGTKSKYCTTVDSSKTTASSFDFVTRQDLKDFIAENGNDYTIKTVLTDGTVYYVSDSDYVTFLGEPAKVSVKLESVDNVTATASYEGSAGTSTINEGDTVHNISEGKVLTLSATPVSGYEFVNFEIYNEDGTTLVTTVENNKTYTVPDFNIVIKPVVKAKTIRTIYLQNDANWSGTPQAHIWYDNTSYVGWNNNASNMTKVSDKLWKYDLPNNGEDYTTVIFHVGDIKAPTGNDGTSIKVGYIYNNSTNTWSTEPYNPSGTTDPTVTITKPDNATISAMYGSGTTITTSGTVPSGTQLTITVTPDDGFTVESITATTSSGSESVSFSDQGDGKVAGTYTVTSKVTITATVKASSSSTPSSNAIYFKNTVGWTNVYVYLYNNAYWNDNGSGSNDIAAGPIQMTLVDGTTDVYYYNIPEGDSYSIVSFTKDSQSNYSNFHKTEAVYRADFSISKPLYTPNTPASETRNGVPYYNNGTWSAYSSSGDTPGAASNYYLRGALTDWTTGTQMYFKSATDDSTVEVEITPAETKSYSFKLYDKTAEKWIGNKNSPTTVNLNTPVVLTVNDGNDSTISLTAGTKYKFSYVINTNTLTVTEVS